jgi:hypothetical protein
MFVLLKKVTISIVLLCYLFTNQAVGETTDEKPKSHINYLDTISAEFRQSTHPPDLGYIKQLYEKELKNRPDPFTYFRYAVIVRYTAQNEQELEHALEIEKEAAMRCLHFLGNSFYAMSLMANIISVSYRENKHIPLDEKRSDHWAMVSQSFEESSLYRCSDRSQSKCWRSDKTEEEIDKRIKNDIEKLINNPHIHP